MNTPKHPQALTASEGLREALKPFALFAEKFLAQPLPQVAKGDVLYAIHGGRDNPHSPSGAELRLSECIVAMKALSHPSAVAGRSVELQEAIATLEKTQIGNGASSWSYYLPVRTLLAYIPYLEFWRDKYKADLEAQQPTPGVGAVEAVGVKLARWADETESGLDKKAGANTRYKYLLSRASNLVTGLLAHPAEAQGWMPVDENTPKDKPLLLVLEHDKGEPVVGYHCVDGTWRPSRFSSVRLYPTHYHPLPKPPANDNQKG